MFKIFKTRNFWLILILVLATFLRLIALNKFPPELFGDELDVGYQAYSLWKTGADYMGQKFPWYLHSLSEWRAPLLMYFTAPFVAIFGLNEWGVRLPVAILGILNVFLVYLLGKEVSGKREIGLWAAFVLAIMPWHLHYSRAAFESTLLLALILAGVWLFIKEKYLYGAICFALSFYTYNTANIFIPIIILTLIVTYRARFTKIHLKTFLPVLLFFFLSLPILISIFKGEGATRFKSIGIFNDPKMVDKIVFKRNTGLSPSLERIFYNKLFSLTGEFSKNYLISFSPQFLFISGDPNPRHNVPENGEVYLLLAPFFLAGIFFLLKTNLKNKGLIFVWLLAAPISSALTVDGGNHATRLFLMTPALALITGEGIDFLIGIKKKLIIALVFVLGISLVFWLHEYFVHYAKEQLVYWDYGYKEALTWLNGHEKEYQKVILNNRHNPMLLRYLFWTQKDPFWLRKNYQNDFNQNNLLPGFSGFKVENLFLGGIDEKDKQAWLSKNLDNQTIYLAFQKDEIPGDWNWQESPPAGIKVLKLVKNPFSQEPLIYLLTKDPAK
ncbi:MAG: glycosyltransferase family 39 protein [Patescibacteria group bacterium]|nr:glycosyltransferase family 39 protein [Patescibacteria group bacterium]